MKGIPTFRSSSAIHIGRVRTKNEDACLEAADAGLWAVADGIGGQPKGDYASELVIGCLAAVSAQDSLVAYAEDIDAALLEVNRKLIREGRRLGCGVIGSTVALLLVNENRFVCLWAGDSRVYRLRGGQLMQINIDHSAQNLIANVPDGESPAALARAVGISEDFVLDAQVGTIRAGDRFLLCTDGLIKELDDGHIAAIMLRRKRVKNLSNDLVKAALKKGGRDNVAVVVVEQC